MRFYFLYLHERGPLSHPGFIRHFKHHVNTVFISFFFFQKASELLNGAQSMDK